MKNRLNIYADREQRKTFFVDIRAAYRAGRYR